MAGWTLLAPNSNSSGYFPMALSLAGLCAPFSYNSGLSEHKLRNIFQRGIFTFEREIKIIIL